MSLSPVLPKGYKMTELGVIPEDWEVKELGELLDYEQPTKYIVKNEEYKKHGVPVLTANKSFILGYTNEKNGIYQDNLPVIILDDFTLLSKFVPFSFKVKSSAIKILKLKRNSSNNIKYIFEQIQNISFSVSDHKRHYLSEYRFEKIQLPHPSEQSAIAEVLSDTDQLIDDINALIAKYQSLKTACMTQLLTARMRLPGFTDDWEVKELGEVAGFKNGYAFKSSKYIPNGKFFIITIANVQSGYMTLEGANKITILPKNIQQAQILKYGDILISMTGNIGRVCVVKQENCLLNQRVGKIIFAKIDKNFGFYILNHSNFIKQLADKSQGGVQENIGKRDIMKSKIPLPTNPSEQSAIAEVLSDFDHHIATLTTKRDKYIAIKQALMTDLLTGRRRLPL